MTVCIAAACDDGERIVTATDGLLSTGDVTGESIIAKMRLDGSGHKATAPWARVRFGSRSSAAGLAPVCTPKPSQAGHQPSELLNEK